jgi:formylglycine-generating enzyme required for sulfatase activity
MPGKRRAVVFGSNGPEYSGKLKYSASDADSFANVLSSARCGFEVQRLKSNVDSNELGIKIKKAAQDCKKPDSFVCYFSGHGDLVEGELWLLLDGTKRDSLLTTAISASDILKAMRFCPAQNRLLILDCCNAGAAAAGLQLKAGDEPALKEVLPEITSQNFLVLAASARLESAVELEESSASFLTSRLCKALSDPAHKTVDPVSRGVSIERLKDWLEQEADEFNRAKPGMKIPSPYLVGQLKGTFYLTVTAKDWPNVQLPWPDGTTMLVLPLKPLDGFALCIGKQPITNGQYAKLISDTEPVGDIKEGNEWRVLHPFRDPRFNDPDQPVVCVTPQDCRRYVDALNRSLDPQKQVTLLPAPALWDYAAFGTEYPSRDPRTWHDLRPNSGQHYAPMNVDTSGLPVNSLEIGNLIGNIWQWCPADPDETTAALRGGGFLDDASNVVPFRDAINVQEERISRADTGFRIAGLARLDLVSAEVRALLDVSPALDSVKLVRDLVERQKLPVTEPRPGPGPPLRPGMRFQTPVRVLIAASPGLENEVAIVRETIARSWISEEMTVDIREWNTVVRDWRESQPGAPQFYPSISPWDGILLLAGSDTAAVHDLCDAAKNYVTDAARWLAYRMDTESQAGWSGPAVWKDCAPEQFADRFWNDHLDMIPRLLHPRQSSELQKREFRNPYRGLQSYRVADAEFFFGRSSEVSELCRTLRDRSNGLLAIQGPSGSGKSSLVRAGLFYRLSLDAVPGSKEWRIIDVERTTAPVAASAKALYEQNEHVRMVLGNMAEVEARLATAEGQDRIIQTALHNRPSTARLVLLFDQFEEVFTRLEPEVQTSFLERVRELCGHPRVNVIVTIRADFYTQFMGTVLGKMPGAQWPFCLRPANRESVFKAIYWPVIKSGLRFEDESLVEEIQGDAGDDAGTLPLLSYAMQQFVDRVLPEGLAITRAVYKSLGGVQGVIVSRANEVFNQQSPAKETVNCLFRRLVLVDENGTATKTPALFDPSDRGWTMQETALMRRLVDARLLCTDKPDPGSSSYTVEIAHEALITQWPELKEWVERSRFQLLQIQQVESAAKEWQQALKDVQNSARRAAAPAQPTIQTGSESVVEKELEINRQHLWAQERLNLVRAAMRDLNMSEDALSTHAREFIRDERDRLCDELQYSISHDRRFDIGIRISELVDVREGIRYLDDDCPEILWCEIPPGEIVLRDKDGNSLGVFRITERLFISRYELTLGQFQRFTASDDYTAEEYWAGLAATPQTHGPYQQSTHKTYPAQFVSWYQAIAYCRWVSKKLRYDVRLPTEWEWVQAATGGNPDFLYPWGRDWDPNRVVYAGAGERGRSLRTSGLYPKGESPIGALDMCGNIYEWCLNEFERITVTDVSGTNRRTTRGGAFFSPPEHCTVRHRLADPPDAKKDENQRIAVAIRLVAENPPPYAKYYRKQPR